MTKAQIEQLQRDLRWEQQQVQSQKEKIEEKRAENDRLEQKVDRLTNSAEEHARRLEEQVQWMRNIIELIAIPKDKLDEWNRIKESQFDRGQGRPRNW